MSPTNSYIYNGRLLSPPLTYHELKGVMLFLPISYFRASEIIRNKKILPIRISPRHALLGITVFDFIDCPVGPYRELALTVPVSTKNYPYGPNVLPLLFPKKLSQYFALYTILLAMSTSHGREHASQMFGYPVYKNTLDINFELTDKNISVEVEDSGIKILAFEKHINSRFSTHKRFYRTIFPADEALNLVELSASTIESSHYMHRLTNFYIGKHPISNQVMDLSPSIFSLQTSVYKKDTETLSIPRK